MGRRALLALCLAWALAATPLPVCAAEGGDRGAADCVCESLCAEDAPNEACPVCGPDFALCDFSGREPAAEEPKSDTTVQEQGPQVDVPAAESRQAESEPSAQELTAEQAAQDGLADSFEALQAMLAEGGVATLGASVTIPAGEELVLNGTIHTGAYGIRVEGLLQLGGSAAVTGAGGLQPVVEVAAGGRLQMTGTAELEQSPRIVAEGGGCGLLLSAGFDEYYVSPDSFLRIAAGGAGAVAVQSEASVHLERTFIEAPGGVGVVCSEDVSLYLCQITAGVAAIEAPSFTADTCALSPAGDANGTLIRRRIAEVTPNREYVARGGPVPDYMNGWAQWNATLRAPGHDDIHEAFGAETGFSEMDTNVLGLHPLTFVLEEHWQAFDLVPEDEVLVAVEVYDPEIPYFYQVFSSFFTGDGVEWLFDGDLSAWTLWRSDDEGESWYDYTEEAGLVDLGYKASASFSERPNHPVLLVWEAEGIGESEILRVTWAGGTISGDLGGDRGGVGRGEVVPDDPGGGDWPGELGEDDGYDDSGGEPAGDSTPQVTPAAAPPPSVPAVAGSVTPEPKRAAVSPALPPERAPAAEPREPSAPEPPAMPDEAVSERSITVSGERLIAMMDADPASVPFFVGELRVLLPGSWLRSLAPGEADAFTLTLWQPNENSVTVSFDMNGAAVAYSSGEAFLLGLPWSGGAVSCALAGGDTAEATLTDGRAEFSLYGAGTYTLTEMPAVPAPGLPSAPQPARGRVSVWLPGAVVVALCAGVGFAFLREGPVKG